MPEAVMHNEHENLMAALDHAIVLRTSWVRHQPRKRGGRTIKLCEGTKVGLRQRSGSWWQIAYHDPFTDRIEDGWMFECLLEKVGWVRGFE